MHICPYGAMAIFILNKISVLEPRTQNRVRSALLRENSQSLTSSLYAPKKISFLHSMVRNLLHGGLITEAPGTKKRKVLVCSSAQCMAQALGADNR